MAVFQGGSANDVITAGAESDYINAGEGNNTVQAGGGTNAVVAGAGNDTVMAGSGDDAISAGEGRNLVEAGEGNNVVSAGAGADTITAGAGNDVVFAGEGSNAVAVGDGRNVVGAGSGADTILSGGGDDVLGAGEGNNSIDAGGGNNTISAGSGSDSIATGAGNDVIAAGEGNNSIAAGDGANVIAAGGGADRITAGSGADVIAAGEGNNSIDAGGGRNIVSAGSGNDSIASGAGDDTIFAGNGNNTVNAGAGNNLIATGFGNNTITTLGGNDTVFGGQGNSLLDTGGGSDLVYGGIGNDVFVHRFGANAGASDFYEGSTGRDTLRLELTQAEWQRADVQADVARFLAHLASATNQSLGLAGLTTPFTFASTGLTVWNIEGFEVVVAGVVLDPRNEAVTARGDLAGTTEDSPAPAIDLLANDLVPDRVASVTLLTPSALGTAGLALSLDGAVQTAVLTFTPGAALQSLREGEVRSETLTYRVTDANGDQATATVTISVTGTNDAPTVSAHAADVVENAVVTGAVTGLDADAGETATLSYALTGAAPEGLSFLPDGRYSFDASGYDALAEGETRVLSVGFVATDVHGAASEPRRLTITLTGTNDAPVAVASVAAVDEGNAVFGTVTALDADAGETATLTYALTGPAPEGLSFGSNGSYFFDASGYDALAEGETRVLSVGFVATDVHGATSEPRRLTITLTGTNDAPVATAAVAAVDEDAVVTGTVTALDADAGETATLTYALTGAAPVGLSFRPDGSYSFDASGYGHLAQGETLQVQVGFTATDAQGASSNEETLSFTITGANDRPVVQDIAITLGENAATFGILSGRDADTGDSDSLTYALVGPAIPGLVVNPSGGFSYAASFDRLAQDETFSFTAVYVATDALGAQSDGGQLTITVVGSNDAPVVSGPITRTVTEDAGVVAVDALGNASDVDSAALSVLFTAPLPAGVSYDAGTQRFLIDLNAPAYQQLNTGQSATVTVNYGVSDGLATVPTFVTWTVQGVNDIPASPPVVTTGADPLDNDARGAAAAGILTGNNTAETIYGGAGGDTIAGQGGADTIYGGSGADSISGGGGTDLIYGGSGNDVITGDANADTIQGGYGADTLTGGAGGGISDVFVFASLSDTGDRITDFAPNTDRIDLGAIDAAPNDPAVGAFSFGGTTARAGGVWYLQLGGDTVVYVDTDGDVSSAELVISLTGTLTLAATDFVL
ncbi:beta strand repeat-containing protein [Paragemmobacter straminiformis]|uniref:Cadherin domain-containing protein n=1 Tax=Paragemmobacter straminiformis TaxID=2045119 RepID=A0A842I4Q5_9RHOB|nr:calcium-binding protein [Gemmobacter straminiformis]MBC2834485.1 hypothetical protein [Gemmobacter straminiformis]